MKRKYRIALSAGMIAVALSVAQHQSRAGAPASLPDTPKAGAAESVEVDPPMMVNIRIEPARAQALHGLLTATGKVQFNDDRTARVLAPLPGQVVDLQLRVGDKVQKDQVLFSIKSREVAALVTDYRESQRDLDLAVKTQAMTKDLFEHQAASRMAFQQAEGELAKAHSQVARAEEALRILGLDPMEVEKNGGLRSLIPVRTPLGGVIIERPLTPGQYVQADSTPLLTVADLSTVWVLVDVFERDIHLVHPGQRVQVTAMAYPNRRFTAQVDHMGDKVDAESRTLKVRLLVSNAAFLLKPEMFISAAIELDDRVPGVTVPAKALFTEGEKSYLFVAVGERRFERRMVTAAPDGDARVRVTSGIVAGDRIVADGALLLRSRQRQQHE